MLFLQASPFPAAHGDAYDGPYPPPGSRIVAQAKQRGGVMGRIVGVTPYWEIAAKRAFVESLREMHASRSAAGAMPSVPLQGFSFGCGAQAASKQTRVCQYLRVTQVSTAASHVHPQRFLARWQPRRHRRLPSTACRTAAATVWGLGVGDVRSLCPGAQANTSVHNLSPRSRPLLPVQQQASLNAGATRPRATS